MDLYFSPNPSWLTRLLGAGLRGQPSHEAGGDFTTRRAEHSWAVPSAPSLLPCVVSFCLVYNLPGTAWEEQHLLKTKLLSELIQGITYSPTGYDH